MNISRFRIRVAQRDGTLSEPDKPCLPLPEGGVPYARGCHTAVFAVADDGTEYRITNVKSVTFKAQGGGAPVITALEIYSAVVDVTVPLEKGFV